MTDTKAKPIHEMRIGRVRAAVWENTTEKGTYPTVTFSKLYMDKDQKWRDSTSFAKEDLLLLAELARQTAGILYGGTLTRGEPGEGGAEG
jgi:hypothetical protein